ncbi:helix-turn-helix domain-containing protein [Neorhizobium sp. T786]|uniref:helix-turn-helix domain-containing protein n=1 Tax=Pseudorhizobium xiangyangii TaxID=2883104 RepID=UPI001CFF7A57|nr:helix-turn-helix domain-containing protein [Neorhizobium xiangyangii]MCB5204235.1 helix-turn-helix domain-containing protein [Neorhizobium xiangyangii]
MTALPGILADISDIAGTEAALKVAQSRGGTRVDLPPQAKANHWLTDLVGFELADKICRGLATTDADGRCSGLRREVIPRGAASLMKTARLRAAEALDAGKSVRETARISGLHERTIWRMKAEDDRQGRLF